MNSGLMYASTLLASMVSQPSGKAVFLHVVTSTSESSAEYPELISKLLSVYKRESHVQYLDAVLLPILEAVCDHEICFGDFENVVTLQHIANNVVNREILTEITAFLFTVVNQDLALQLVTRGISILESLTDHNYGMQVLKSHLIQTTAAIAALLERLVDTVFTKEEREVYAAISTFIEFIQLLNSPGPENYSKNEIEKGYVDTSEAKKSKRSKRRTDMIFKKGDHIDDTKRLRFDVSALSTPHSARGIGRGANRGLTRNMPGRGFNNNRGFNRGFGRGYGRGRGRGQSGGDDHFRARRQNTSRPPSMHVDDFVNMEKEGQTMMANNQNQHQEPQENNERFQRQNYNNQNKWNNNGPRSGFRRSYGGSSGGNQGQRDDNNGDWNNRSFGQYGGGNRFHSRSNSDWNNQGNQNQGYRDSPKDRSQRGGYWAGPKQRDDNRFGGGGNYMGGGYRQGGRGRHQRTFTR